MQGAARGRSRRRRHRRATSRRPTTSRSFVAAAVERFGRIDVLVNNAGRSGGGVTADTHRRALARRDQHQPQQRLPGHPRGAQHRRHAERGHGPDHQHRLHRRQAGRRARRALLGLQARRRRLHQGARQRAGPNRHHRQRGLPRLRRDADGAAGPAGLRRGVRHHRGRDPREVPGEDPARAATPPRRRSPALSATWPPTPPPPSPRRPSTSAAALATSREGPHMSQTATSRGGARDHGARPGRERSTG